MQVRFSEQVTCIEVEKYHFTKYEREEGTGSGLYRMSVSEAQASARFLHEEMQDCPNPRVLVQDNNWGEWRFVPAAAVAYAEHRAHICGGKAWFQRIGVA
eukprot:symbB.v1.2.035147.t1/scaffold4670.1/size36719/6